MRVWSIISTVFFLLLILLVVIFFVVEKTIPTSWAQDAFKGAGANVQLQSFEQVDAMERFGTIKDTQTFSVAEGERTLTAHTVTTAEVVGKDAENTMIMHYQTQNYTIEAGEETLGEKADEYYYKNNGLFEFNINGVKNDMKGSEWRDGILAKMQSNLPLNAEGTFAYAEILENNIERITQKGVYVMAHASLDNVRIVVAFDFLNRQIKGYTEEIDTLEGDVVVATTVNNYSFTYPQSIALPKDEAAAAE